MTSKNLRKLEEAMGWTANTASMTVEGPNYPRIDIYLFFKGTHPVRGRQTICVCLRDTTCCGLREMHGLDTLGHSPEEVQTLILNEVKRYSRNANKGLLYATTINEQGRAATALKRDKWTRSGKFLNPDSGNTVTLWRKNISRYKEPDTE